MPTRSTVSAVLVQVTEPARWHADCDGWRPGQHGKSLDCQHPLCGAYPPRATPPPFRHDDRPRAPSAPSLASLSNDHESCDLCHNRLTLSKDTDSVRHPPFAPSVHGKADYRRGCRVLTAGTYPPQEQCRLLGEFNQFLPFGLTLSLSPPTVTERNRYRKRRLAGKPRENAI
jgi:hypothetical protein